MKTTMITMYRYVIAIKETLLIGGGGEGGGGEHTYPNSRRSILGERQFHEKDHNI